MKKILLATILALLPFGAQAKKETYKVDTKASLAQWEGKKIGGSHQGELKFKSGSLEMDKGSLVGGTVEIDMTTLKNTDLTDTTMNAKLVTHLKSDDFFSIEKNPTATLKLEKVEKQKDGKFLVTGALRIKGDTHPISFPVEVKTEKNRVKASGEMKVDRTLYNIRYRSLKFFPSLGDKVIHDEFSVKVNLVANK